MSKQRILVIKYGAAGDILRTSPLFRVLKGDIYLCCSRQYRELSELFYPYIKGIITPNLVISKNFYEENITTKILKKKFDLVLSLEESFEAAQLASSIKTKELIGIYINKKGNLDYTDTAKEWFDMSLISKLGKQEADRLKYENRNSFQDIHFRMIGKKFSGEEYILNIKNDLNICKEDSPLIGIEKRVGLSWPCKRWNFYDEFMSLLKDKKIPILCFNQQKKLLDYINKINKTDIIISGDTLAMHVALALKKRIIALFLCTSPYEIYGYGRMTKVISQNINNLFYLRSKYKIADKSIKVSQVYRLLKSILQSEF